jgi:hypothetical protein
VPHNVLLVSTIRLTAHLVHCWHRGKTISRYVASAKKAQPGQQRNNNALAVQVTVLSVHWTINQHTVQCVQ